MEINKESSEEHYNKVFDTIHKYLMGYVQIDKDFDIIYAAPSLCDVFLNILLFKKWTKEEIMQIVSEHFDEKMKTFPSKKSNHD